MRARAIDGHTIMSVAFTLTMRLTNGRSAVLHPGVTYVIEQDPRGGFVAITWAEVSTGTIDLTSPGVPL